MANKFVKIGSTSYSEAVTKMTRDEFVKIHSADENAGKKYDMAVAKFKALEAEEKAKDAKKPAKEAAKSDSAKAEEKK